LIFSYIYKPPYTDWVLSLDQNQNLDKKLFEFIKGLDPKVLEGLYLNFSGSWAEFLVSLQEKEQGFSCTQHEGINWYNLCLPGAIAVCGVVLVIVFWYIQTGALGLPSITPEAVSPSNQPVAQGDENLCRESVVRSNQCVEDSGDDISSNLLTDPSPRESEDSCEDTPLIALLILLDSVGSRYHNNNRLFHILFTHISSMLKDNM
jgi:hypothetical protein